MADDDAPPSFSSPACFLHEVDPAYAGLPDPPDMTAWADVKLWHTSERQRLIAERLLAIPRGPDLRPLMREIAGRGGHTALPVVVEIGLLLEFHFWQAGGELSRGVWGIPVPAEKGPCIPDVVIAPVVGYDEGCYRPGYSADRLSTIYPQRHDIPMDRVVTEAGIARH